MLCACIPKEWLSPEPMPSLSEDDLLEWVHIDGPSDGMLYAVGFFSMRFNLSLILE